MSGLYRSIRDDIQALFAANWSRADCNVYWRSNDLDQWPDPAFTAHFVRAEVDFGREVLRAFGNGPGRNERTQFGSAAFTVFAARATQSEDTLLDILHDVAAALRSKRVAGTYAGGSDLSFIGDGSGFDIGPDEDGNWFMRGVSLVFEYRFAG